VSLLNTEFVGLSTGPEFYRSLKTYFSSRLKCADCDILTCLQMLASSPAVASRSTGENATFDRRSPPPLPVVSKEGQQRNQYGRCLDAARTKTATESTSATKPDAIHNCRSLSMTVLCSRVAHEHKTQRYTIFRRPPTPVGKSPPNMRFF